MKSVEVNDSFTIETCIGQAMIKDREAELRDILKGVSQFHDYDKEYHVFYPQNMYDQEKTYKLYFFFKNEVVIGESVKDENKKEFVTITRMKYQNINEIKILHLDDTYFLHAKAIEIGFNNGKRIKLDSLEDSKAGKVDSFTNKIERIYTML
ncbi:DUF3908 family protein [Bacillus cereus]|uniref:DUF3908 family protein n=1 Tax=Bacillus cereus TaxID=1396 RepID=UPI0029907243|nr:DUF3908 family protein [Bacillus cereus]MDW8785412.1 DUF3908 family protein [Bacillus cereus]MDZ4557891.1 DUF3908 family protein [Bacillus cereus]